jgi:hypothetical protein
MNASNQTMTRYLLGELPADELALFEQAYFDDPRVFAELTAAEEGLVDDYARDRLPPDVRARFEQVYLADPRRRERVQFARALVTRVDGADHPKQAAASDRDRTAASARSWIDAVFGLTPALRWSVASLLIANAAGGLWFYVEWSRSRQEDERTARTAPAAPDAPVAPPVAPVAPAPVAPDNRTAPVAPSAPDAPAAPVVLALAVGPGVRSANAATPVALVIPAGASEVRLVLTLEDRENDRYRVILRAVAAAEVLRRDNLKPAASGPAFTIPVPTSRLASGDYLLTLQGASGSGEFDDLSQSLIRVDKRQR